MFRLLSLSFFLAALTAPLSAADPAPVAAVAWHPQGSHLVAGGYRQAIIFDAAGKPTAAIAGQTQRVTAIAFSPDGKTLALASGEAGKSGEVRLYDWPIPAQPVPPKPRKVIPGHADIVHSLDFSPDGSILASAGYDRVIHLWKSVDGTIVRSLKDHSDTVNAVAFSRDGSLLASASADRAVKVWNVADGTRLYTLSDATDWVYTLAWHPDGRRLAAGGIDRSIRIWEATAKAGKLLQSNFAHTEAVLKLIWSADGSQLWSVSETSAIKLWDAVKLTEKAVFPPIPQTLLSAALKPDGKVLAVGGYDGSVLLLDSQTGKTLVQAKAIAPPVPPAAAPPAPPAPKDPPAPAAPKIVDRFPSRQEREPNDSPRTAPKVTLPVSLFGTLDKPGQTDWVRFDLKAGEELGVELTKLASTIDPVLELTDERGTLLRESTSGLLAFRAEKAGTFALGIRDREYRGEAAITWRLHLGPIPIVTGVFPPGGQRGTTVEAQRLGVFLGVNPRVKVTIPADAAVGSKIPLPATNPPALGSASLIVGEFPEPTDAKAVLPTPATANGILHGPHDDWRFRAKKGETLHVDVAARRDGSALDPVIEILDASGKPVPMVTLRCVARTFSTFRDHDSATPGIRLDTWNEMAMSDYLYVSGEVMRIRDLPKGPDDDCQFWQEGGSRRAYFGTSTRHHANASPMYKVEAHPPGTQFPANGMPVFRLDYRNDDGGPGYGQDSMLRFTAPADGEYLVRVSDSRSTSGDGHFYRLTLRAPRPDFRVSFNPTAPSVIKGGSTVVGINVERLDGFTGPVELKFENVPAGLEIPATRIGEADLSTAVPLYANLDAAVPPNAPPLKLIARATIDGKPATKEVVGQLPKLEAPGDLRTTTAQSELVLKPGQESKLLVKIERANGFNGRVPVEVRGLPYGVRVMNVGLNGILILPGETQREIVLYAEPWVKPTQVPIAVFTRREGKGGEHGAKGVTVKVE